MKKPLILFFRATLLLFLLVSVCGAATTLYVTSENAELKSDSSSFSSTLTELRRGAELTLVAKDGRWYQVSTVTNDTGWIYRGKVSGEKPEIENTEDAGAGLGGLLGGLSDSDIKADAADSSRSIRGLSPEAKEYARSTGTPRQSQDALDSVISRTASDSDIVHFLKNGKIGEYAD
ncbi:MAG: SH3 domain-containing protein [Thermodesulfobacteriota bacterium]|nr:SH3 domain-containing protein [Thermodesulfobacteriota bacterium]